MTAAVLQLPNLWSNRSRAIGAYQFPYWEFALNPPMPIRRDTPRASVRRTELSVLEKYQLALASVDSTNSIMLIMALATHFQRQGQRHKMMVALRLAALMAQTVDVNANLASLPKSRSTSCGPLLLPGDFDPTSFYEQFRFRKEHFWMFLQALRWTLADGTPRVFKFGPYGHTRNARADHVMMVLLRRLVFPARWPDINRIMGGSRTTCSDIYNFGLRYIFHHYVPLIQDLHRWKHLFAGFAKRLSDMGAPFDNLISFVDGHFDPIARPTGDACVHRNLWDYQMYNPLHKDHGIMFQGAVLVNWITLCCQLGPLCLER